MSTFDRRLGLGVLALILLAGQAQAEDKAAARQAYLEASKNYDLNQFAPALEAFKRAYWNYEDPAILFNIAQCHRALKHKAEAIDFYKTYLRKAPEARNREVVLKMIAELESAAEQERTLSRAPPEGTLEGRAKEAERPAVVGPKPLAPKPAAAAVPRSSRAPRIAGLVVAGIGAALMVAGGASYGVAVGKRDELENPAPGASFDPTSERTMKTTEGLGLALLGLGAAAIVTGVVVAVVKRERPVVSARPAGIAVGMRF